MKRQIEGLHKADQSSAGVFPNVLFLVRTERARYRWHAQRPYYALQFVVLEPKALAGPLPHGTPLLHAESTVEA